MSFSNSQLAGSLSSVLLWGYTPVLLANLSCRMDRFINGLCFNQSQSLIEYHVGFCFISSCLSRTGLLR